MSGKQVKFCGLKLIAMLKDKEINQDEESMQADNMFNSTDEKKQKRILFIIDDFLGGGAERVACRLLNRLCRNYQVYLVYFKGNAEAYFLEPAVYVIHIKSRNYEKAENNSALKNNFFWHLNNYIDGFRKTILIKKIKKHYQIDTTISFLKVGNMVNVLSGGRDKKIVSERMDPSKMPLGYYLCSRYSCFFADCVVFQTKYVQGMYNDRVKAKSCIIPNPTEISCKVLRNRGRKIVAVGRLEKQKNHKLLIKAFSIFHETHPEYHLYIYGEGDLQEELLQASEKCHVHGFVHFEGFRKNIHAAIADAEQFVLSSDFEGLSNALMEAMMMGHACISTDCAGSTEIIENEKNGLLVPVGDVHALSEAMCRLSDDPVLRKRLGHEAALTAEDWNVDRIVDLWENVL